MKNEELKDKFKTFLDYLAVISLKLILVGVVLTIVMSILILNELKGAKDFCESTNGTYNFQLSTYPTSHFCNKIPVFNYKTIHNVS